MDDRCDRLRRAMDDAGVSLSDAVERWGWNANTLKSNMNGKAPFGFQKAKEYGARLKVRPEWLYDGAGPMRSENKQKPKSYIEVPTFSWVQAGSLNDAQLLNQEEVETVTVSGLPEGVWFATVVHGDSMDRVSPEGSTIVVNADDRRLESGQYYLFSLDGATTFKRYFRQPVERLEPQSTNPENTTIYLDGSPGWLVVGRVHMTMMQL